jgi:transcriptional regulator with XRE-family HTH domain
MNLREIRKARGLTVPALAEKADMPKRTIEDIERKGECKVSTAIKLADALDMTLDELCGRDRHE